VKQSIFPLA